MNEGETGGRGAASLQCTCLLLGFRVSVCPPSMFCLTPRCMNPRCTKPAGCAYSIQRLARAWSLHVTRWSRAFLMATGGATHHHHRRPPPSAAGGPGPAPGIKTPRGHPAALGCIAGRRRGRWGRTSTAGARQRDVTAALCAAKAAAAAAAAPAATVQTRTWPLLPPAHTVAGALVLGPLPSPPTSSNASKLSAHCEGLGLATEETRCTARTGADDRSCCDEGIDQSAIVPSIEAEIIVV